MTIAILILCFGLSSSPVDGKWWNVEAGGQRGNQTIELDLLEKDGKLLGTIKEFAPEPRDILNGKLTGNSFSFDSNGLMNGRDVTVIWSGEFKGDEMRSEER